MSNKYVVDTDVIDEAVASLKQLQKICAEYSKSKLPKAGKDKGQTHQEMVRFMKNINKSFADFEILISKTIEFLGGESQTIQESDKKSAQNIINKI